jgi:hypothetical protein
MKNTTRALKRSSRSVRAAGRELPPFEDVVVRGSRRASTRAPAFPDDVSHSRDPGRLTARPPRAGARRKPRDY